MDDYKAITPIANVETAKIKRATRKDKLTCLTRKLEEYINLPLHEQNADKLHKTNEDFIREKKLHEALQSQCEQLLESKEGTTPEKSKLVKKPTKYTPTPCTKQKRQRKDSTSTWSQGMFKENAALSWRS